MKVKKVNDHWNEAAKRLGIENAHRVQYTEMRKAFYSGFASCLIANRDEVGVIENEELGALVMKNWLKECLDFFNKECEEWDKSKKNK